MHLSSLLFVLLFPLCFESAVGEDSIINDDYCDLHDGSDENLTSACAGVLGSPGFFCRGSGVLNVTIPSSRVQDGVCDCCDGEDEVGSPFFSVGSTPCPQSCSEHLITLKAETLASYKHISAGLRAKNDLVNTLNRKKLREKQSYDGLLHEYAEIQKLYFKIKYWLERDSRVESTLMFAELRSRVRQCAAGFFEACDYFHDGTNTMYPQNSREELLYDFPELWDEQGPLPDTPPGEFVSDDLESEEEKESVEHKSHVGSLDPSKVGNSLHRKKLETVSEKIEEVIRKNQARDRMHAQLSGPERVENSFCAFEEMDTVGLLGGEESLRVHKNVKQYLDWVSGKGGVAARKLSVEQTRRKSTLFGAYLDAGSAGNEVGLQALFEMVGMVLAPLTVPYTELTRSYYDAKKSLFRRAESCVLEQSGDVDMLEALPGKRQGSEDESEFLPCDGALVWFYRALLELSDESSPVSIALRYLDYNNYDWIMTRVVTRVNPHINSNMWYFRIIQQTPYYYYRYYFGDGASKLPVYRNACTLREGLRVAKIEAEDMRAKIAAKKQQVEAEGGQVEANVGADGRLASTDSTGSSLLSSFQSSSKSPVTPDFGPDGSWQVLNGTCLSRHEGEYVYKVCAFQEVYQDHTKLGHFSHWGDRPLEGVEASPAESKIMSFKNKIRNKNGNKGGVKAATDYLADLVKGSTGNASQQGAGEVSYTNQFYSDGAACHNGIIRHAVVQFKCASFAEIVDVVEYEMCGYEIVVNTPIACTRDMEEAVLRRLQQLDVYGFGSEVKKDEIGSDSGNSDKETSASVPQKKSATVLSQEYKQKKRREEEEVKAQQTGKVKEKVSEDEVAVEVEVEAQGQSHSQRQGGATGANVKVVPVQDIGAEKAEAQAGKRGRRDPPGKQRGTKKPYRVTFNE